MYIVWSIMKKSVNEIIDADEIIVEIPAEIAMKASRILWIVLFVIISLISFYLGRCYQDWYYATHPYELHQLFNKVIK